MKVLFTRRHHPGSWLIRAVTWSEFSHVDIDIGDGRLIGACAPHGVVITPRELRLAQASKAVEMDVPCDDGKAIAWALSQIGRPYDWLGCLGIGLHRDWQQDSDWFCSEFAAQAMQVGLCEPYRTEVLQRLTPQDLYVLNLTVEVLK